MPILGILDLNNSSLGRQNRGNKKSLSEQAFKNAGLSESLRSFLKQYIVVLAKDFRLLKFKKPLLSVYLKRISKKKKEGV